MHLVSLREIHFDVMASPIDLKSSGGIPDTTGLLAVGLMKWYTLT